MRAFLTSLLIVALIGISGFTYAEEAKVPETAKKMTVQMEKVFNGVVAKKDNQLRLNEAEVSYILKGEVSDVLVGKKVEVKGALESDNMTIDVKEIKEVE